MGHPVDVLILNSETNRLKTLKKTLDDADRARKAAAMTAVVESTKALVAANAGLPFLVHRCDDAQAQNKIVDAALKQVGCLRTRSLVSFIVIRLICFRTCLISQKSCPKLVFSTI